MSPKPDIVEVSLEVYIDGKYITAVSLDAAAIAQALASNQSAADSRPATRQRAIVVDVPAAGRLRLLVDLRSSAPSGASDKLLRRKTFVYDGTGKRLGSDQIPLISAWSDDVPIPPSDEPYFAE